MFCCLWSSRGSKVLSTRKKPNSWGNLWCICLLTTATSPPPSVPPRTNTPTTPLHVRTWIAETPRSKSCRGMRCLMWCAYRWKNTFLSTKWSIYWQNKAFFLKTLLYYNWRYSFISLTIWFYSYDCTCIYLISCSILQIKKIPTYVYPLQKIKQIHVHAKSHAL